MDLDWEHRKPVPIVKSAKGGGQSKILRDWTLFPWDALALVAPVLKEGEQKYGRDNWKNIPPFEHLQHLMEHSIAVHQCLQDDDHVIEHLTHVVCRALFALQVIYEDYHESRETNYYVNRHYPNSGCRHPLDVGEHNDEDWKAGGTNHVNFP